MLEALAQLIIVAILLFLLLPRILPGTSVAKLSKKYGEYWAVDKIFKILQFAGMMSILQLKGTLSETTNTIQSLKEVQMFQELEKFVFLIRISRKILRFLRAPPLFQRIGRTKFLELPASQGFNPLILQTSFKAIADIFLWLFFLTDHLIFFHLTKIFSEDSLAESCSNLGKIFLTGFHSFNLFRLACLFYRIKFFDKEEKKKELRIGQCDLLAHVMDFGGLVSINLDLLDLKYAYVSAIVSSLARLSRLQYK